MASLARAPHGACLTAAVLATFGLAARPAHGAPTERAATSTARCVRLLPSGAPDELAAVERSLRELLARIGVALDVSLDPRASPSRNVSPAPSTSDVPPSPRCLEVWLDLPPQGDASLLVVDPEGDVRMRREVPRDTDTSIAVEEVAHVVRAAVEMVVASPPPAAAPPPPSSFLPAPGATGGPASTNEAPPASVPLAAATPREIVIPRASVAPTSDSRPAPRDRSGSRLAVDLGAFIEGGFAAGGHDAPILGITAAAVLTTAPQEPPSPSAWLPALWLTATYHAPFSVTSQSIELEVTTLSARLLPALRRTLGATWALEAGLGGGVDFVATKPVLSAPVVASLGASRFDPEAVATALVATHARLGASTDVTLAVRFDGDLTSHTYMLESAATRTSLYAPWRVRPTLMLGVTFDVVTLLERRPDAGEASP